MLNDYITGTQLLLHDTSGSFYSTPNLTRWVNEARRRVAGDTECIRVLASGIIEQTIPTGSVTSIMLLSGGSGYSVLGGSHATISPPDQIGGVQATVGIHLTNGVIDNVFITNPGSGYTIVPTITFVGPGSGASALVNAFFFGPYTTAGVEKYSFSLATSAVQQTPGVSNVLWIRQVTVSWGSLKPVLDYEPFTRLQAYYRAYSIGIQNFPSIWSQLGQGEAGTFYLWPIPSQQLSMDWDCICQPLPLASDTDPEAIPLPFTDAVKYYAAYLALMYAQRSDDAEMMRQRYKSELATARANSGRSFAANYYYGY